MILIISDNSYIHVVLVFFFHVISFLRCYFSFIHTTLIYSCIYIVFILFFVSYYILIIFLVCSTLIFISNDIFLSINHEKLILSKYESAGQATSPYNEKKKTELRFSRAGPISDQPSQYNTWARGAGKTQNQYTNWARGSGKSQDDQFPKPKE